MELRRPISFSFCDLLVERPAPRACCVTVAAPIHRPDLATYSQAEQLALGNAPDWNSPDITTNREVPWQLLPETSVVVRNLSASVSAINAQVRLSTSAFGIGMPQTPLSALTASLGPGAQVTLTFPLSQAILNLNVPDIGVYVDIYHPYDKKLINNHGEQIIKGVQTSVVGRNLALWFPVVNASASPRTLSFSVMPNDLGATLPVTSSAFAPWEQQVLEIALTVPASAHGSTSAPDIHEATVVARDQGGALVGGLTFLALVDD